MVSDDRDSLSEELLALPAGLRRRLILKRIQSMVEDVLGEDAAEEVTPSLRLFDLGVGSLMAVELKRRLELLCDADLPVSLFLSYSTLGDLSDRIVAEVARAAEEVVVEEAEPPGTELDDDVAAERLLAELAALEEQLEP